MANNPDTSVSASHALRARTARVRWLRSLTDALRRSRLLLLGVALVAAAAAVPTESASAGEKPCATPGTEGLGGTLSGVINTYYPGKATAAAGATSIPVGSSSGAATAIGNGDLLLVVEMQDEAINSSNTTAYGANAGSGAGYLSGTAGTYEYVVATGPVAGGSVPIKGSGAGGGLANSYVVAAASKTHGQSDFQVVRVPQYSTATLGATLTAQAWNGSTGGILAFDVAGALSLGSTTVSVNGLGFRGGAGRELKGAEGGSNEDFRNLSTNAFDGDKGEGAAGTPEWVYNQQSGAIVKTEQANDGYPEGSTARGAPGNAGGGGTDGKPSTNEQNSGGGGGANGGAGGQGGNTWISNLPRGGMGGAAFSASATALLLGGGGGSGTRNNSKPGSAESSGGAGGGMVLIRAGSVTGAGTITADGATGPAPENDGAGGGGAGGSIEVLAKSGGLAGLTANAIGGTGANAWPTEVEGAAGENRHGPGGGGGGGVVVTSSAAGTTSVAGGAHGTTTSAKAQYNAQNGAAGTSSTAGVSAPVGAGAGSVCLPALTTSKSTSTPSVIHSSGGETATYTITVTNGSELGTAQEVTLADALPAGFTYASTASFTVGGGATRTSEVNPKVGDANPVWGTLTMPGGSTATITFTVNIAASVTPGTYTDAATPSYLDPQRSTKTGETNGTGTGPAAAVTVSPSADVAVTKTASAPKLNDGEEVTFTVTAKDNGPDGASGVQVTDLLPAGLEYVSSAPSQGSYETAKGIWTVGALANGASATLKVTAKATKTGTLTNTATKTAENENDPTPGNNSASASVEVSPSGGIADLALNKTVTSAVVGVPSEVVYTLTVTNNGPDFAQSAVVTDPLPAGEVYLGDDGGCTAAGQTVTCELGEVANKATRTIHLRVRVEASLREQTVLNTANVTSTTTDPAPANNSSTASLRTGPASSAPQGPPASTSQAPPASAPVNAPVGSAASGNTLLGCTKAKLVLNDVYMRGGRVQLVGAAANSLVGHQVKILFNEKRVVATTTVRADGSFSTTAALPPARIRSALKTRYTAVSGALRSAHVKLTRRLQLEPPQASGQRIVLSGQVVLPLTKPIAPIVVEQQLECRKKKVVKRLKPPASGRFRVVVTVPASAKSALYQLTSRVAGNTHSLQHGFKTYSLILPVLIP